MHIYLFYTIKRFYAGCGTRCSGSVGVSCFTSDTRDDKSVADFELGGTLVQNSYCTRPCVSVGVNTCVKVLRLRFDVHFISMKPFIILLSNLSYIYLYYTMGSH